MLLQGRYRLIKRIGKGGLGKTFLAVDEGQFPPIPCVVQELLYETLKSFEQKAQQQQELGKHPQIPALLSYFQQEQYFYLVQEFVVGTNLAQVVEEEGVFNETQVWQILADLLPVLQFISDRHIIHRNIKPKNIIRRIPPNPKGEANLVIVDFSAAKIVTEVDCLTTENSIGSPEYAAPEQTTGKAVFASDLYSLGVTCIYLLTHISPFDLFDIANSCWVWRDYLINKGHKQQDTKHLRLGKILDQLLQNIVSQRFQSANEVIEAMGMEVKSQKSKIVSQNFPWQYSHTLTGHSAMLSSINALAFSAQGNILASTNDQKNINLWNLNTQKVLASLSGHCQAVKSVAFSPNGKILASASDDKTIKLWQMETLTEIYTLLGHSHAVKSVAFSPDGEILASGSWDKTVKLWNVSTGVQICTLAGHQLHVSSVAFSPQGQILASASYDRTIRLWQISCQKLKNCPCYTLLGILSGHTWAVLTVAFSPDGKILATGSDDNTIKLWEVNTGQLISTLVGHSWSVVGVAFTADGETLISASWDKTVKLWRVSTTEEIVTLSSHTDSVSAVAVSQGQLIATGSKDKTIKLWQLVE
ncbi:serine/threonine-protein kinase [Nostoc sp. PA-18-2419]|uniref:serine/threonine-protein kinase n=1 Tax=Nostoc sp. PA-18-2419 TaxID=2575443 RepID=UPI001108546D|nr:serine/threonine-protein kinase [Nostoc sp. PA-18-2419]